MNRSSAEGVVLLSRGKISNNHSLLKRFERDDVIRGVEEIESVWVAKGIQFNPKFKFPMKASRNWMMWILKENYANSFINYLSSRLTLQSIFSSHQSVSVFMTWWPNRPNRVLLWVSLNKQTKAETQTISERETKWLRHLPLRVTLLLPFSFHYKLIIDFIKCLYPEGARNKSPVNSDAESSRAHFHHKNEKWFFCCRLFHFLICEITYFTEM